VDGISLPGVDIITLSTLLGFDSSSLTRFLCAIVVSLGPIRLASPFLQAALSGYSDWPMRVIARRHGAAYTVHEVMLDRFALEVGGQGRTGRHLKVTDEDHPVGAQLMGSEPALFGPAAQRLVAAGFDVIDINFGCPVKSAMGGCRGGYHLGQPDVALEIVRRTRDAVPPHIPVTLKLRRGLDDSDLSRDNVFRILEGAIAAGATAFTVHGRTVQQKYVGPSRWQYLRDVVRAFPQHLIIGSGDLFTAEDCLRMLRETGVGAVSIARGAIGNPWIFSQCAALARGNTLPPPPDVHSQRAVLEEHAALIAEIYGTAAAGKIRKVSIKYARLHPQGDLVRNAFATVCTDDEWRAVVDQWYTENRAGCEPVVDEVGEAAL
jgi:tRNA-dihydrouridine synthase B